MTKAVLLSLGLFFLLATASPAQTNSAADLAVNRAVMDQANTILLRQKLEDAKAAAARGDLPGAAQLYEDAKALVDQIGSGIDAETAQTISGLVATRLELARQAVDPLITARRARRRGSRGRGRRCACRRARS